jgi:hypothetical protein
MSFPTWTHDGNLAFGAHGPGDTRQQVYLWDGQTAVNISQNPLLHNAVQGWNGDGLWAFATFFSPGQFLYVRDAANQPLATLEGGISAAWGANRHLAFCRYNRDTGWSLWMWDGEKTSEIARGYEIYAQWQSGNGDRVVCSSG